MSRARNAGEIAFWICPARPSAEIVREEEPVEDEQEEERAAEKKIKSHLRRTMYLNCRA